MASLYYPTKLMAEEMLPRGQITGWTMGNYAGFPILHFYSTLPFAAIALLGHLVPMTVVFKLVTLLGPTSLPLCAAYLFRRLGYGIAACAVAAASMIPFLLQQGNSMWGGNIPSVLAGEYCHAIGLALSLVFLGYLYTVVRGTGSWWIAAFLAFRIMDVWKPWPIREADHRIPGGLGIMLDDALAAAFAAAVVSSLWKLSAFLS